MDATESDSPLDQLQRELHERGWITERSGDQLVVSNPNAPALNDRVTATESEFVYAWGPSLGPLDDVAGAADRLSDTLRTVRQDSRHA